MRHSSKNAIPTEPQRQPAIAQNFHIKNGEGGKEGGKGTRKKQESERGSSGGGGGVGVPSSRRAAEIPWERQRERGSDKRGVDLGVEMGK